MATHVDDDVEYLTALLANQQTSLSRLQEEKQMIYDAFQQQIGIASLLQQKWTRKLANEEFRNNLPIEKLIIVTKQLKNMLQIRERISRMGSRFIYVNLLQRDTAQSSRFPREEQQIKAEAMLRQLERNTKICDTVINEMERELKAIEKACRNKNKGAIAGKEPEITNTVFEEQTPSKDRSTTNTLLEEQASSRRPTSTNSKLEEEASSKERPTKFKEPYPSKEHTRGTEELEFEAADLELSDDTYWSHMLDEIEETEAQEQPISAASSTRGHEREHDLRVAKDLEGKHQYQQQQRIVIEVEQAEHTLDDIYTKVKEPFIDSHCHLDFIDARCPGGLRIWKKTVPEIWHKCFSKCIPNFVDPRMFTDENQRYQVGEWIIEQVEDTKVLGASYGCHPHFAGEFENSIEDVLVQAIRDSEKLRMVAIGECGFDFKRSKGSFRTQRKVFKIQLALAKEYEYPIIIHCRSGGKGNAEEACLETMEEVGISRFHYIHRHCFLDTWDTAEKWMNRFEKVYFGFTSAIASWGYEHKENYEVLKRLPLQRMLLETDAPYFRPHQYDCIKTNRQEYDDTSFPSMAVNVAFVIAKAKNLEINEVIRQTRENAERVYGSRRRWLPSPGPYIVTDIKYTEKRLRERLEEVQRQIINMENELATFPYRKKELISPGISPSFQCAFCGVMARHFSDSCPNITNGDERWEIVTRDNKCQFCLTACAGPQRCTHRNKECFYCSRIKGSSFESLIPDDGGHHQALCNVPNNRHRAEAQVEERREELRLILDKLQQTKQTELSRNDLETQQLEKGKGRKRRYPSE